MTTKPGIRAEAARLQAAFVAAGATAVEADVLQPAETLLDLYGEDIRSRAYVTNDPLRGELMLRPDFTVPVVQMHMKNGAAQARYSYAGEVFRKQEDYEQRAAEYLQVGYELFGADDPARADAEVFALFASILPGGVPVTGDMGLLIAAVNGLGTSERRKRALMRHIWRPRRFRTLLDRFSGRGAELPSRTALLSANLDQLIAEAGPQIGLRSEAEVRERVEALRADATAAQISVGEVEVLTDLLTLKETAPNALDALRSIAVDMPSITPALDRLEARLTALSAKGVDVDALQFEASHGRSSMEYYDGFVFAFTAPGRPDLPPVATGGRYDALTRVLGQGRDVQAVGGVIRPALSMEVGP
ncbi:MAG: ATP phosphoribosyltransferase regulatory subunit [Brevirhabdus sp.]